MTQKARLTLKDPSGAVTSLAFSSDGTMLATGGYGEKVCLWDVASGKEKRALKVESGGVASMAISPDNVLLATTGGTSTGEPRVYKVATGEEFARISVKARAVVFGAGHKLYTAGPQGTVQVWDLNKQGASAWKSKSASGRPAAGLSNSCSRPTAGTS